MTQECGCPFCPLIKANVQTCDVLVVLKSHEHSQVLCDDSLGPLAEHFHTLMRYCRNNCKQKVGTSIDLSQTEYSCNVYRLKYDTFKICFHTLNAPEDPIAPMD